MAKKKNVYKIRLLWFEILCTISTIISILGICMCFSMPILLGKQGMLIGSIILTLSVGLIAIAMTCIIGTIVSLKGYFQGFLNIDFNSGESGFKLFILIAILTIILAILMALSFFF